jgi:hypothetical protein
MKDSTLISDLPGPTETQKDTTAVGNTYMPMNMHADPFGNNNSIKEIQPYPREDKRQSGDNEIQRLPSRDIVMNTNIYTQDDEIKANYIPKVKNIKDYVRDYEEEESEKIKNHRKEKNTKNMIENWMSKFQDLFLLAILYFISQMGIVSKISRIYLTNLGIFDIDGNLNNKGMVLKSIIFSMIYSISSNIGDSMF